MIIFFILLVSKIALVQFWKKWIYSGYLISSPLPTVGFWLLGILKDILIFLVFEVLKLIPFIFS